MKRLLKMYSLDTKEQYFEHVIKQEDFKKYRFGLMTKKDKILCIKYHLAHNQPQSLICSLLDLI